MKSAFFLLLTALSFASLADDNEVLTVRSPLSFDDALAKINEHIERKDYKISIIQRCDFGLREVGFKTDKYRIVFFGKLEEVRAISGRHPELSPFLPLRITVIAEDDHSMIASMNPDVLLESVTDNSLVFIIKKWKQDISEILQEIQRNN